MERNVRLLKYDIGYHPEKTLHRCRVTAFGAGVGGGGEKRQIVDIIYRLPPGEDPAPLSSHCGGMGGGGRHILGRLLSGDR